MCVCVCADCKSGQGGLNTNCRRAFVYFTQRHQRLEMAKCNTKKKKKKKKKMQLLLQQLLRQASYKHADLQYYFISSDSDVPRANDLPVIPMALTCPHMTLTPMSSLMPHPRGDLGEECHVEAGSSGGSPDSGNGTDTPASPVSPHVFRPWLCEDPPAGKPASTPKKTRRCFGINADTTEYVGVHSLFFSFLFFFFLSSSFSSFTVFIKKHACSALKTGAEMRIVCFFVWCKVLEAYLLLLLLYSIALYKSSSSSYYFLVVVIVVIVVVVVVVLLLLLNTINILLLLLLIIIQLCDVFRMLWLTGR